MLFPSRPSSWDGGRNAVIYYFPILLRDSIKLQGRLLSIIGSIKIIIYSIFATASWVLVSIIFLSGTIWEDSSNAYHIHLVGSGQVRPS